MITKALFRDATIFLNKISVRKILNAFKVLCSYYITKYTNNLVIWGYPISISIEPTTACNLRCPECPSGLRAFSRDTGNLKRPNFEKWINQVSDQLIYLIFYFQGEPYINPNFLDMVAYANKKSIYTITSTNGHFLNEENCRKTVHSGLDRIIISIDGLTQETYESYRKEGKLANVIEGARNLVRIRKELKSKTPYIIFQFLVVRHNEHEIDQLYQLADEVGVDEVKLKSAQVYDYKHGNPLIPLNEKYARYKKNKDGTYSVKHKIVNHCWKLWHSCVITWDGSVVPCCFDKDAKYKFGELKQRSFKDIWRNKKYNTFRKTIIKGREHIDICQNCSEGCKVFF